jgi:hypothetical protein
VLVVLLIILECVGFRKKQDKTDLYDGAPVLTSKVDIHQADLATDILKQ